MDDQEPMPIGQRLRLGLRQHRALVAVVVLTAGVVLTVLAVGDLTPLSSVAPFPSVNAATDQSASGGVNYNLAFVIAGPILILVGGYLVGAYYVARRKFEHLMVTKSKAEFLRNIPEIEEILWDLTPTDEQRYMDKRSELKVRR